jgi:hypothetical protein
MRDLRFVVAPHESISGEQVVEIHAGAKLVGVIQGPRLEDVPSLGLCVFVRILTKHPFLMREGLSNADVLIHPK